jgi:hypothetical protein
MGTIDPIRLEVELEGSNAGFRFDHSDLKKEGKVSSRIKITLD